MTNGTDTPMPKGTIVQLQPDGDAVVGPAVTDWDGVLVEDTDAGKTGICRHSSLASVLFEPGLDLVPSRHAWVSRRAPGVATNVENHDVKPMGKIVCCSKYCCSKYCSALPFGRVLLRA